MPVNCYAPSRPTSRATSRLREGLLCPTVLVSAWLVLGSPMAMAEEHTVQMLNKGPTGRMVFEPSFLKAAVGDTVVFTPTEKGLHNSHATLTPTGAEGWTSEPDTELRITLDAEGVYLYVCQPHEMMGMVGVIQAGDAINKAAAEEAVADASTRLAMNKDRFRDAFAKVE